jgi:hypothetical protein
MDRNIKKAVFFPRSKYGEKSMLKRSGFTKETLENGVQLNVNTTNVIWTKIKGVESVSKRGENGRSNS